MLKIAVTTLMMALLVSNAFAATKLVYLSCDVPPTDGKPATHFDFTLDEPNGTVTFYVKSTDTLNKEKAVFGPRTVTWSIDLPPGITIARTIDRTNLQYLEELNIGGSKSRREGQCSVIEAPSRKF